MFVVPDLLCDGLVANATGEPGSNLSLNADNGEGNVFSIYFVLVKVMAVNVGFEVANFRTKRARKVRPHVGFSLANVFGEVGCRVRPVTVCAKTLLHHGGGQKFKFRIKK
jgi:hypothetical protein